MGRSFLMSGFGPSSTSVAADIRERMEKTEAARTLALRGLLESDIPIPGAPGGETYRQRAERLGLDESSLANAAKFFEAQRGHTTPATAKHGAAAPMEVGGERFVGTDSWVDGHGDTHIEAHRPVGGGRYERVVVVEERVNPKTRLVTRAYGGR